MKNELLHKIIDINNYAIFDGYAKANSVMNRSSTVLCSISGGSDSDIVLDIIRNIDDSDKVTYFWVDTGLEYLATKEHLKYLEQKYGIEIKRIKACKPIPACCKQYGVPFLSKYVSEQMMRLQKHNFQKCSQNKYQKNSNNMSLIFLHPTLLPPSFWNRQETQHRQSPPETHTT